MKSVRIIVLCLAIIGALNKFGFCEHYLLKEIENTENKLTGVENAVEMWNLLSKIFEYEESVTVIGESHDKIYPGVVDTFIRLLQQPNLNFPVFIIDIGISTIRRPSTTREDNSYRGKTNTSYILMMDDNKRHSIFLEEANANSDVFNTRATFVIFTHALSFPMIHKIFRLMWTKYQINKVIVFDHSSNKIIVFNFLKDRIKAFNITHIEQILEYTYPSIKDLDGYPIRVSMLHQPPMSIAIPNSTRFIGVNQNILDTLQSLMNFTAVISKPQLGHGSMVQLNHREVGLVANMKFITSHNKSGFEFTTPLFSEEVHIIVPKAERVPLWLSMYQIFDNSVWLPTACLFTIFVLSWLCVLQFHHDFKPQSDVGSITINVFFLLTGQPVARRLENYLERLLVMCGSIFAIIMVSCFAGHLFQRFSEVAYYPDIDDFAELEESGLRLVSASGDVRTAVSGSENPKLKTLFQRMNICDKAFAFDLKNGVLDQAVLARLTRVNYELANNAIQNNGSRSMHVMKQSLGKFAMAYTVPQGSIFLQDFNFYLNMILESGLIKKWYYDSRFNIILWMRRAESISSKDLPRAFTFSDLRLAWFVSAVGLTISSFTCLIELAWHSLTVKSRGK